MLVQLLASVRSAAADLLLYGGVITALEMLLPQSRYSILSRIRGIIFWSAYIVCQIAAGYLFNSLWTKLGIAPYISINVSDWFKGPLWFQYIGYLAVPIIAASIGDFFYYWFHRLQHASPFLWRFHAVHHSIEELSGYNSTHHVTDAFFRIPFIAIPISLFLTASPGEIIPVIAFVFSLHGFFIHSCTRLHLGPFRYIVEDNKYHRIHHSREPKHVDHNFSAFAPIWDALFGTAYFPAKHEWPDTGIEGQRETKTLTEYLVRPFRRETKTVQPAE